MGLADERTIEPATEDRFAFGDNWRRFLEIVDDERIASAERSLREMLGADSLAGMSFLDIGSGSGLFSLVARRLGAKVDSFDYDGDSVACTEELRRRHFPDDPDWTVGQGSILDDEFVRGLGVFNVVYAWGVLHHTGDMWRAIDNADSLVAPGGLLFLAIYNDQGRASRQWAAIKRRYVRSGRVGRAAILGSAAVYFNARSAAAQLLRGELPKTPGMLAREKQGQERGMSVWYDLRDWVGGYPFEVAKPEEIFDYHRARGFSLLRLKTCGGGHGCNEYVFRRASTAEDTTPAS